jgi:hypothetical protein
MPSVNKTLRMDQPAEYRIVLQGRLDKKWSDYFAGMSIETRKSETGVSITVLNGLLTDQSALHGVIRQIRDLDLPLLLVQYVDGTDSKE